MTSSEAVRDLRHAMIQKSADLLELWARDPALLGLPAHSGALPAARGGVAGQPGRRWSYSANLAGSVPHSA